MDMNMFNIVSNQEVPTKGKLLISSPFLNDIHFMRSVILMVEHDQEGSVGLIMNKNFKLNVYLNDLMPGFENAPKIPVYKGGPVGCDTLFYINHFKDLKGAIPILPGLFLNGDFEQIKTYILNNGKTEGVVRFFTGYAGWSAQQLEEEIQENSWVVTEIKEDLLSNFDLKHLWKNSLYKMGNKYALWANYPIYPGLN